MAKPTYWELLRRPEWQRKRLEMMDAANFECEHCGEKEKTLNVHHKYYTKGAEPWDYPDNALVCLCEDCHGKWHGIKTELDHTIAELSPFDILEVLGFVKSMIMRLDHNGVREFSVGSYEEAWALVVGMGEPTIDPYCAIDLHLDKRLTNSNLRLMFEGHEMRLSKSARDNFHG